MKDETYDSWEGLLGAGFETIETDKIRLGGGGASVTAKRKKTCLAIRFDTGTKKYGTVEFDFPLKENDYFQWAEHLAGKLVRTKKRWDGIKSAMGGGAPDGLVNFIDVMAEQLDEATNLAEGDDTGDKPGNDGKDVKKALAVLRRMKETIDRQAEVEKRTQDLFRSTIWTTLSKDMETVIELLDPPMPPIRVDIPCHCNIKGANASGTYMADGSFVVSKGSDAMPIKVPDSGKLGCIKHRRELEDNGVIKNGKFVKDYTFAAPSPAAAVVLGRSACNGLAAWISDESGKPLGASIG